MGEQTTDQDLVKRIQAGEKQAFDLLVLKYQNRVVKLVSRFVHDPMEAQDVAQEAFIKAFRAIESFRGDSAFYTWLYRIATNAAKNHLVAQSRRPPASGVDAMEAEQYAVDTRLKEKDTPESLVVTDELKAVIFRTIEALRVNRITPPTRGCASSSRSSAVSSVPATSTINGPRDIIILIFKTR